MANYPTTEELDKITNWNNNGTLQELIMYLQSIWEYDPPVIRNGRDNIHRKKVFKVEIHTWGWSGNEDIIERLHSTMFWMICWRLSRRGGHYEFEINPSFMYTPKMTWGDPRKAKAPKTKENRV